MRIIDDIVKILGDVIVAFFGIFVDLIRLVYQQAFPEYKPYQSKFVPAWKELMANPTGFVVTGTRGLSVDQSFRHLVVVGPTGSRKTVSTIQPTLLLAETRKAPKSFIVLDVSRQLFQGTAGHLEREGYRVLTLNFKDVASSTRFNPLIRATTPSKVRVLSSLLVRSALGDSPNDAFWSSSAQDLIGSLIELLQEQPDPSLRNLGNVHEMLIQMQANPDQFDAYLSRYGSERVVSRIKALYNSGEKLMGSIIATCRAALSDFADPEMAALVAFDDLDFASFREVPSVLFLQAPVMEASAFSTLTNTLLEQMLAEFMREVPEKEELPIFFCLDEVSVIRFRSLSTVLANARKHKIAVCATIQSEAMLEEVWSKSERVAIMQNAHTKLYLPGQDLQTSQALEQILGRTELLTDKGKQVVPLLTREDIRTIGEYEGIVLIGHRPPIRAKLTPFYKQGKLLRRSGATPPRREQTYPNYMTIDLNLEEPETTESHESKE